MDSFGLLKKTGWFVRKRYLLLIALLILTISILALGFLAEAVPVDDPTVRIISNGVEESEPFVHFEGGGTRGTSVRGTHLDLDRIFEMLPVVEYADDFQIVVGANATGISYSLFDENFEFVVIDGQIMRRVDELSFPDDEGEYILVVHATWVDPDSSWAALGHVFRVIK